MESATKVLPQPGSPYRTQNECSGRTPSISQFGFGSAANSAGERSLNRGSGRLSAIGSILVVSTVISAQITGPQVRTGEVDHHGAQQSRGFRCEVAPTIDSPKGQLSQSV